jgi:tetratricopeptide (TPR) repeat protein
MKPSLCLNMIVKNEGERMARCLRSALPYVKAVCICDTGSTDDTKDVIERVCKANDVPFTIAEAPFIDFSQARNAAFAAAKTANGTILPWCQFALLMDADMELVVDDADELMGLRADAPGFNMMQKGGSVSYANRRIVNLDLALPLYMGVTHEYIDAPDAGMITGSRFIDHADGSNRKDKYQRDADLLEKALKTDPTNGRYIYYLANTYMDWGKYPKAALMYQQVIDLNGWDEEVHSAMMRLAECHHEMKRYPEYVSTMLQAYNFRPSRTEPLYSLAKYYREKGDNPSAILFAKQGMKKPRPNDLLFVNDFVYEHGLRYEYSIAGAYDESERNSAFQVTDDLALDSSCPEAYRKQSRWNLYFHTKPLSAYCPSFVDKKIEFDAPIGYTAMNPSVEECNGILKCNIRCVNYRIDEHGRYMIGPKECNDAPIDTRNFLCSLDANLDIIKSREILWHRPPAKFPQVTGLEDIRLYRSKGDMWFSACVREQASNGTCQQLRGKLVYDMDDQFMLVRDDSPMSGEATIEKNWMPMPTSDVSHQDFVYRLDTIRHIGGDTFQTVHPTKLHIGDISGSSQLLPFRHGFICVVHEASTDPTGKRTYWHRFAWFNHDGELRRLSLPFVFLDRQIEFCAGLSYHPDHKHLLISYGVRDEEAHIAKVAVEEVAQMIWKFHEN